MHIRTSNIFKCIQNVIEYFSIKTSELCEIIDLLLVYNTMHLALWLSCALNRKPLIIYWQPFNNRKIGVKSTVYLNLFNCQE